MKVQSTNYTYRVEQKWAKASQDSLQLNRGAGVVQLEMSASSKLLKECVEKAKDLDQARQDRVRALKKEVEAGTYQVSTEAIANALIEEGFFLN